MSSPTFRNEFSIEPPDFRLSLDSRVVALGSCFASAIGTRLAASELAVTVNPLGTLFHPLSIASLGEQALTTAEPDERLFLERDGQWVTFQAHSDIRADTPDELARRLRHRLAGLAGALRQADVLLITLGTAWVHRLLQGDVDVTNNHKQPASRFRRRLVPVQEICDALARLNQLLARENPGIRTVYTVSPVRHGKSGLPDNAVSKAILRLACHELVHSIPGSYYFPAYELLLDDLRDYRFYAPDGLHPSPEAEHYISSRFLEACCTSGAVRFIQEWEQIQRTLDHRPFNENSASHRASLERCHAQLDALRKRKVGSPELPGSFPARQ